MRTFSGFISSISLIFIVSCAVIGQVTSPVPSSGKGVFFDSNGEKISNNEFVDIRMANFHYPDATIVKTLEDGTIEFRLQKVPQEGMKAPLFEVKTIEGERIKASELRGKVVVLNFWFIGCPICLAHKPKLNELAADFAGNENVVFIAMTEDTEADVKRFLRKEKFDYIQSAESSAAMKSFAFAGYPKNIVIGKTGEIVYWRSTIKAWDKFRSVITTEIAK